MPRSFDSAVEMRTMKEFYRESIGGQVLVPAAAVIPARKAYVKVAAVKTLVVGHQEMDRGQPRVATTVSLLFYASSSMMYLNVCHGRRSMSL